MPYNLTNITAAKNPFDLFSAVNELSGGLYTAMILLALYIILFMVFRHHTQRAIMLGVGFIMVVISIGAFFLSLIAWYVVAITFVMFIISLILYKILE